jgi:membrane associated rhomboid family serine protease
MLLWFFLCLANVMPVNIANTVHTVGLVSGVAWGFLASLTAWRNR